MTVLTPTTSRRRTVTTDARSTLARAGDLVAAAAGAVRTAWRSLAQDGQLGASGDIAAARFGGARA